VVASADFDTLYGASGNDSLESSMPGPVSLDGGQGNDTLNAAYPFFPPTFGTFYGGDGDDLIIPGRSLASGPTTNYVYGGAGNDTIESIIAFSTGLPSLNHDYSNDYIDGGPGNDLIIGPTGQSTIIGGTGTDTIYADGQDLVWAVEGENDQIFALGNDTVFLGGSATSVTQVTADGNDTINGQLSQGVLWITLQGGGGTSVAVGDNYSNHINGEYSNQNLWERGGSGVDEMIGGTGTNHFIMGGAGDFVTGGGQSNAYLFNSLADGDTHIYNFSIFTDVIGISAPGFGRGFTAGETLTVGVNLINGTASTTNTATLLYDGKGLYFDPDGTGPSTPTLLAGLVNGPATLAAGNFYISGTNF
jgi:Ca2+-binding RTX toxin-like protein